MTILNFHQVNPRLYRGGQPRDDEWRWLYPLGVDRVVKLNDSGTGNDPIVLAMGMELEVLEILDHEAQSALSDPSILTRIDAALVRPRLDGQPATVFVHCTEGKDRTGIAVARYRVMRYGWCKADARAEWDRYGSHQYKGLLDAWEAWQP